MWEAIEADLARAGWSLEQVPEQLSWRAVHSMLTYSQPGDARYAVLVQAASEEQLPSSDQMTIDVEETIANAKRMGWG